ncbi:hypothetical protein GGX14DRAFT_612697, partial [Mycena pura]
MQNFAWTPLHIGKNNVSSTILLRPKSSATGVETEYFAVRRQSEFRALSEWWLVTDGSDYNGASGSREHRALSRAQGKPRARAVSGIPMSPISLMNPDASMEAKQKRANPLTDLIDTKKSYVDQLTGIIRKVAAAWSRSNLPPPELDTIFRGIEAVYKANRSLLAIANH